MWPETVRHVLEQRHVPSCRYTKTSKLGAGNKLHACPSMCTLCSLMHENDNNSVAPIRAIQVFRQIETCSRREVLNYREDRKCFEGIKWSNRWEK